MTGSLSERVTRPVELLDSGAKVVEIGRIPGKAPSHEGKVLLFDNGTLYFDDSFRSSSAAYVLQHIKRNHRVRELVQIAGDAFLEYQQRMKGEEVRGIDGFEDADSLRGLGDLAREAASESASDIHIFPSHEVEGRHETMFRIHGELFPAAPLPSKFAHKMMAATFVACGEKETNYLPKVIQQGRLLPEKIGGLPGYENIRCQWVPLAGQTRSLYLRLQRPLSHYGSLEGLKYRPNVIKRLHDVLAFRRGGVIVAAPTNAGKTTLMGMLCKTRLELRGGRENGVELADPTEYKLPMRQMAINVGTDPDERRKAFDMSANSINRMDPDFVQIGEIRGGDVGDAAVKIAGAHFLLGSVHTDDSFETFPHLVRIGLDRDACASPRIFSFVMSQRLLKELCPECKRPLKDDTSLEAPVIKRAVSSGVNLDNVYVRGPGCHHCHHRGIIGQRPALEIIPTDETFMKYVHEGKADECSKYLASKGIPSLYDEAMYLVNQGVCDPFEAALELGEANDHHIRLGVNVDGL